MDSFSPTVFVAPMSQVPDTLSRQWLTLRLIPRHPRKITTRELTERLEREGYTVTKRTVERDLLALSLHFPLISDTRSMPYGWSWSKDVQPLDLPALSPTEALSFLMLQQFLQPLVPASLLEQLSPYFSMAEQCLLSEASAKDISRKAGSWLKKVESVQPSQGLLPAVISSDIQWTVQEALLNNRQLSLAYRKRGETKDIPYTVHPLGLVQRGGVIYLVCTLFAYPDIRLLALHRIRKAEILNESVTVPKGFKLSQYVAEGHLGFGQGESIEITLRFTRGAGEHLWETPLNRAQTIRQVDGGTTEVSASVTDTPQLRWWILGFGDQVEVIAPESMRNQIAQTLQSAARLY